MTSPAVGYRPLYLQVRERLARHLGDGRWLPGATLPSDQELAREMGVSPGTVRKALDALTAEHVIVRRQGRGTYVAEYEDSRVLVQFFRLWPDTGERLYPQSSVLSRSTCRPSVGERAELGLGSSDRVFRIERVRLHGSDPIMRETLSLPAGLYPGMGDIEDIPDNVYRLYAKRWGLTVVKSREWLKAVAATARDAWAIGCPRGTPLLSISRVALDIRDRPVEYRTSVCLTEKMHYRAEPCCWRH